MNLSNWNPFKFSRKKSDETKVKVQKPAPAAGSLSPYDAMQQMMQQFLREPFFISNPFGGLLPENRWFGDFSPSTFQPSVDVTDEGQALRVTAELPGMSDQDIELSADQGSLTIKGEKRSDASAEEGGCYRTERAYGYFHRVVPLPTNVALEGIEATFEKGVLTVRIPKTEASEPTSKRIAIQGK